jgi:N-succinyldiaminopimelate aminotransferase
MIEPFYDSYPAQVHMAGGICKYIALKPSESGVASDWSLDMEELKSMIGPKTRLIVINTPQNPLGKMFTHQELEDIAALVLQHPRLHILSDEACKHCYQYYCVIMMCFTDDAMAIDGEHVRIASLSPEVFERTITVCSAGKMFSCTGWKVGWAMAPASVANAIAMAHQWVPFCTPPAFQNAVAVSIDHAKSTNYFVELANLFRERRDLLVAGLKDAGYPVHVPQGGYFVLADVSGESFERQSGEETDNFDYSWCRHAIRDYKVGAIPASAFYSAPNQHIGEKFARFAFCKRHEAIAQGMKRLKDA